MLECSGNNARAALTGAENELIIWQQTYDECDLAVRAKEGEVLDAKDRLERAARAVVCNVETTTRLTAELERLQAEVVDRRSALRFIWGKGINGELPRPLVESVQRVLQRDLLGMESTPASAAWSAAFNELLTNFEAELPS